MTFLFDVENIKKKYSIFWNETFHLSLYYFFLSTVENNFITCHRTDFSKTINFSTGTFYLLIFFYVKKNALRQMFFCHFCETK